MRYKLLKKPFFGRFMVKWRNPLTPEQMKEWKPVETQSASGGHLKGLFAWARKQPAKATIVLGHPMGKAAKGYFLKSGYTDLLLDQGFNVLVFDINGFGESSVGSFSFEQDVLAIGRLAAELTPELPLGYHGISLGGQFGTLAFTDANHPFRFAVIESATTSLEEFWVHYPRAYKILRFFFSIFPKEAKKTRTEDRIKEVKNLDSLLLIYAWPDTWTPLNMGERLKQNSPVPTRLWVVDEADHAAIVSSPHKSAYFGQVLEYFEASVQSYYADRTPRNQHPLVG